MKQVAQDIRHGMIAVRDRLIGEACHAIDVCSALAGSPPVKIYAESAASSSRTDDILATTAASLAAVPSLREGGPVRSEELLRGAL